MEIAVIVTGSVEYDKTAAACDINELIEALEIARDESGATHVTMLSGNYRGAKYQKVYADVEI